ncbi:MAG: cytidine deaminase [Deltaproteobacteria bacterium]|nr:cytidine deaminase [Deltaproteobacteria bacterium]
MSEVDWDGLFLRARAVRLRAYAPYSGYRVGAALLCASGRVFEGCNVESASYGLTICAERVALAQMVAGGDTEPVALAVVTAGPPLGMSCGMCRQALAEFAADLPVRVAPADGSAPAVATSLGELLPRAFRRDQLA